MLAAVHNRAGVVDDLGQVGLADVGVLEGLLGTGPVPQDSAAILAPRAHEGGLAVPD